MNASEQAVVDAARAYRTAITGPSRGYERVPARQIGWPRVYTIRFRDYTFRISERSEGAAPQMLEVLREGRPPIGDSASLGAISESVRVLTTAPRGRASEALAAVAAIVAAAALSGRSPSPSAPPPQRQTQATTVRAPVAQTGARVLPRPPAPPSIAPAPIAARPASVAAQAPVPAAARHAATQPPVPRAPTSPAPAARPVQPVARPQAPPPSTLPARTSTTARVSTLARGRVATPFEIRTVVRLFSETLDYRLDILGIHYSGLTNAELFGILAEQDRDFARNNRTLRQHIKIEVQNLTENATRLPTERDLEAMTRAIILDWTVRRMEASVRDIHLRRLTEAYARRKLKDPLAKYQTIGMRTGALRDAVAKAKVVYQ